MRRVDWVQWLKEREKENEHLEEVQFYKDACDEAAAYVKEQYGFTDAYAAFKGKDIVFALSRPSSVSWISIPMKRCFLAPGVASVIAPLTEEIQNAGLDKMT